MSEPTPPPDPRVTLLLSAMGRGDPSAPEELWPIVYEELRRLAARRMASEPSGHTLQPTALVHEAYFRLVGGGDPGFENRAHFFGSAARAMRRILVERARRDGAEKRGGGRERKRLEASDDLGLAAAPDGAVDLLALDEALSKLEAFDADLARVVSLRYFAGLSVDETADALGVSPRTVKRDWSVARAWLFRAMTGEAP